MLVSGLVGLRGAGRRTWTHSWTNLIQSGNAEQHSQTDADSISHLARYSLAMRSSAARFWGDKLANASSSEAVRVRAKSSAEAASKSSLIKEILTLNGERQSIRGAWTYVRRKRIARTQRTLRMPVRVAGCSRNKRWIGAAMNVKSGLELAGISWLSPGKRVRRHSARARWAKGLPVRRACGSQLALVTHIGSSEPFQPPYIHWHRPGKRSDGLKDGCRDSYAVVETIPLK